VRFVAIESRTRLALLIFVAALLAAIGVNLALYLKSTREFDRGKLEQTRMQATLLSASLASSTSISETQLKAYLTRYSIPGIVAVYSPQGQMLEHASAMNPEPDFASLSARMVPSRNVAPSASAGALEHTVGRREGGYDIAESPAGQGRVLVLATATPAQSLPTVFYVLIYQLLALLAGTVVIGILLRWLLKPYRRVVEAARHSPVRGSPELSESEFVVETFQVLISQLQAKERELAELHSIEKRRAERSERFSERLISNIPSGLVTINSSGTVTSANGYASDLFGSDEIAPLVARKKPSTGKLLPLFIDYHRYFGGSPQLVQLVTDCLSSGASFRREEVDVSTPDGRLRHLGLSISPMTDPSHNIEGALCLLTDITEIIELRERMKLQENLANLGEMAAGLAHEFKNSLATIQGYIQLLDLRDQGPASPDDTQSTRQAILNEVRLLAQLVTDFLNFARPQKLMLAAVDLDEVIRDCERETRSEMTDRGVRLVVEGDFPRLQGDESMLRRAFVNLLRNAAEAIGPGSTEKRVDVLGIVEGGARCAHVRIRDTGIGIPSENLHQIFIPFFTTKSRGYGIGLALVQKILMAHGGSVTVERSDSSGTTFHCRLPISSVPFDLPSNGQKTSDSVK
jgi:two-component system nitrogen regulation sensor histidine kinase GlnL